MPQNLATVSSPAPYLAKKTKKGTQKVPIVKPGSGKGNNQTMSSTVTKVGVWDLQSTEFSEFEPPENTESLFNGLPSESVIGGDGRKMVPKKHLMPGGKYRAIVKLFLRFAGQPEGSSWAMATGWLIENDLLVTAGHCAFDWSHNYGRLSHVKCYIGYTGREAVKDKVQVQLRMGTRVAVLDSWLSKGATDSRADVAFIRVNSPFTGVTPLKYAPTPLSGVNERIGVAGYPGDLMKKSTGEKGALMYEMYLPTNYTLEGTKSKMLQYTIDTYGGNSGSPVLRQSDMTSIGVHVLGGSPNSASVISGKYGNSFDALKAALKLQSTGKVPAKGFRWVTVPKNATSGSQGITKKPIKTLTKESEDSEGSFEDTSPMLGPSSKETDLPSRQSQADLFDKALKKARNAPTDPLGALAAYGLHVAGMRAREFRIELEQEQGGGEDGEADGGEADGGEAAGEAGDKVDDEVADEAGDEATSDTAVEATDEDESMDTIGVDEDETGEDEADVDEAADSAYEGVAERAMLTEAAFLTFCQLGPVKAKKLGYLDPVMSYVAKYSRTCGRAGTIVFPRMMAPALLATVAKIKQQAEAGDSETGDPTAPVAVEDAGSGGFGPRLTANREAIIEELNKSIESSGSEAFDGNMGAIISNGLRIPGPIIANVAQTDLSDFVQRAEAAFGQESNLEAAMEDETSVEYLYDGMAQRALIGEAMLETILNIPADKQRQEGIFSWVGKAVQQVGKTIAAPVKNFVSKHGATLSKVQKGVGKVAPWVGITSLVYAVGKDIYKAAKKKEFAHDDESSGKETNDGEAVETDEGDWDTYFKQ
ncbi:hypothetical protein GQ43DRAFT_478690 [Delitschia confertaspora ATCC 74209]|uniref:Serine protease n=1 Tax=Delitschia confertaspora ATCC 74209 TaxID=1513339 RepID=A0A9P4JR60_9PLEO|nr:hypothetical protein GQ43DRAFT_478690 [Delitschia confertaspora ATCC 74209]